MVDEDEELEEEIEVDEEADPDEADLTDEPPEPPETVPAAEGAEVESIETILAKKEEGRGDDDESGLLNLGREERLETLTVKVVPPQPTEFVCKNCYLVKHQSQLKDKKRQLCRDCA